MQTPTSGLGWEIDDGLKSEIWLAHEALKPMCDALSAHRVRQLSDMSRWMGIRDLISEGKHGN